MKAKCLFLVIFLLTTKAFICLHAQDQGGVPLVDSLHCVLQKTESSSAKISILKELVNLSWQSPQEVVYLKEIMDVAIKADSFAVAYSAMAGMGRYYYNQENLDSLIFWSNKIDSLSLVRKECPDALFVVGRLVCNYYLWSGSLELAMDGAIKKLDRARKEQQEYGLIRAGQSLALVYQRIDRDEDAVVLFREGLLGLRKNGVAPTHELQYLSEMLVSVFKLNLLDEAESLLKQYKKLLDNVNRSYEEKGLVFPVVWHQWYVNSFFAQLYILKGQLDVAKYYIDKAALYADSSSDEVMKTLYYKTKIMYYQKVKNYPLALKAVDKILDVQCELDMLKVKVDLLRDNGEIDMAYVIYDELLYMSDTTSLHAFARQIDQLRTLNNLNDMENKSRELVFQENQIKMTQRLLLVSVLVTLVLLILLYMLGRTYWWTRRLKNELLNERISLTESERQLRAVKEAVDLSSEEKSAFIASISHEVRTPLNAIVGFSELLVDNDCEEEEKREFATLINTNSELLMNLVNDVLDLSQLESDDIQFLNKPSDLVACCKNAFAGIEHLVQEGVKQSFTSFVDSYIIHTDSFRVEQLLTHLLRNAAKFTDRGEINLSLVIDEPKKEVRFSVTDTGCGIPVEHQNKIFERFEKLDDYKQGTGLGLSICGLIAKRLGGTIFIDPTYKEGARFVFVHPIK